jgi:hypothetical protein
MYKFLGDIPRWQLSTPAFMMTGIDNNLLKEQILESTRRVSDDPASTFFEDFEIVLEKCPEAVKLLDMVEEIGAQYDSSLELVEFWGQIHQQGESCNTHHHYPSKLSWVYYVTIPPKAGKFYFIVDDTASVMPEVDPVEGMLMFFPGWISHKVTRNLSEDLRISIAGNFA